MCQTIKKQVTKIYNTFFKQKIFWTNTFKYFPKLIPFGSLHQHLEIVASACFAKIGFTRRKTGFPSILEKNIYMNNQSLCKKY